MKGSGGQGERTFAAHVAYHPSGAVRSFQYLNANDQAIAHETITFDERFRPRRVLSGPLDLTYGYDRVGNVRSITDPRPDRGSEFWYDDLDRLETVTGFGAMTYTYDDAGNRLTKGGIQFTYDPSTKRLHTINDPPGGTFTYDHVGSLTGGPQNETYTYTALNMLASATVGGVTSSYATTATIYASTDRRTPVSITTSTASDRCSWPSTMRRTASRSCCGSTCISERSCWRRSAAATSPIRR